MVNKIKKEDVTEDIKEPGEIVASVPESTTPESVTIDKATLDSLISSVEELKVKDEENQKQLKMLYHVADKGRIFNYENSNPQKRPFKVKLSLFADGIITGWRTLKDELIKHPTTGLTVGESQEYELLVLNPNDEILKVKVDGYPAFSNARYNNRIEGEVLNKKEDFQGNMSFDVKLEDGRIITLDSRFVN